MSPPQLPHCSWDPPAWKGHRGHPQQLRDLGQVSPLCRCLLSVMVPRLPRRGLLRTLCRGAPWRSSPQTHHMPAWSARCPQGGYQEDGKPRPQEPRLPEVRQREATPPGSPQWGSGRSWFPVGTRLVPAWFSAGLLGGEKRQGGLSPCLSWGLEQLQ